MFNKNIFKKNEVEPIIKFVSVINGLDKIKELQPKAANKALPQWWKDIPQITDMGNLSVKRCPGIHDILKQGYILPMWVNADITLDKDGAGVNFDTGGNNIGFLPWAIHPNEQFLDYTDVAIRGRKATHTVKIVNPWRIITPPGYSTMVLPLTYEFNPDFTVMPGIFDTDIFHGTNIPIIVHSDNKPFSIKMGDPIAMYIPFKRIKSKLKIYGTDTPEFDFIMDQDELIEGKREDENPYRKMQKERDSND
jgi:hypothetical protein